MTFSGALTITDLDDFLTPSQACIIPVRQTNKVAGQENGHSADTQIEIDANNNYYEVATHSTTPGAGPSTIASGIEAKQALKKAEISLNDCLACSGCITSTESMLITLQSQTEVLDFIRSALPKRTPVLSLSPQTLASLSASYSNPHIPLSVLLHRIRAFLSRPENGAWHVWDTTFARHLSLKDTVDEFRERKEKGKQVDGATGGGLPMLASACPGWVCYAEKAQGDLLPLLGASRSSQAIMGGLVKTWWGRKMGINPDEIYHVTAMPCYDKKLEASRSDFYSDAFSTRDVDCVLTTGELDLLLSELGFNPLLSVPPSSDSPWPELIQHQGSSSGSYLNTIIHSLQSRHPNPTRIIEREIRNSSDNVEYLVEDLVTHEILFRGAKCYGFRNLQNLVRKVGKETGIGGKSGASKLSAAVAARRKKKQLAASSAASVNSSGTATPDVAAEDKKLDFVEVMACPGGCVNGGGQMKPKSFELDQEGYQRPIEDEGMRWSTKEWVATVEKVYWSEGGLMTPPPEEEILESKEAQADRVAEAIVWDVAEGDEVRKREFLRTSFRRVESDVLGGEGLTPSGVKW
ncbi:hypothetical protein P7C73_g3859, partial [Tremellales sp. Uapishka_1]